ncbi:NAD(P)/FAD-dependent oxidoreductase [Streptomyces scabiei]|uniref:NAD(P)/FAD-dependent oxidoreductase n=1 Tax=Streptomyces scabiei TaxID=1930 RepID=UPI00369FBCB3
MNRIVVVGASAGGLAAAEALRRQGYGGEVTLIGDERLAPYDRPPLSKQILDHRWQADHVALRSQADLGALKLDLRLGVAAVGLDQDKRSVKLADGTHVQYDSLVIATGVRPRRPWPPGADNAAGVHVLRTLDDALGLRARLRPGRRLVVVGAGFVGTEVAAVARTMGVEVTVVEPVPVPLAHAVGRKVGLFLAQLHVDRGVDLRTGVTVDEILTDAGEVAGVKLADGTVVPADDVLLAVGSVPNTEWLVGSGLALDDGLVCDEFSAAGPRVYGVGDVARWHNPLFGTAMRIEHRTNAAEQGMAVAYNLLHLDSPRPFAPVPYFWTDQYEMKIQCYGHLRGHEECAIVEGDLDENRFLAAYRTGDRLTAALAVGMPPKTVRAWRSAVGSRAEWSAVTGASAAL